MDKASAAVPEPAGSAGRELGPSGGPHWAQLPYAIALAATASGLVWVSLTAKHAKPGMLTIGCALLAAAVARLVLPERMAGLLVSRRRLADVMVLASLGTGILVIALVLPPSS